VCVFILPVYSQAQSSITIIKSGEFEQYQTAIKGFSGDLKGTIINTIAFDKNASEAKLSLEIREKKPSLLLAVGSEAASFCTRNIKDIPVVFCMVLDPEGNNLTGFANITGVSLDIPYQEHLKAMQELKPGLSRVGLIYNPTHNEKNVEKAKAAAEELGLSLVLERVYSQEDIAKVFSGLLSRVDFMWIIPDDTVSNAASIKYMLTQTLKSAMPLMGISENYVKAGALLALIPDYTDIGRQAAELAAKIIKEGVSPQDIAIAQARKTNLILNMNTASAINLDVPSSVQSQAEEVFR
jgi:putative ABC transport system substrate-binding protein